MRIEWTVPALDEFERCQSFYENVEPRAASRLAARVHRSILRIRDMPDSGRPGLRPGTRECVVQNSPYIVVYRHREGVIEILHVFHERQDWQQDENRS